MKTLTHRRELQIGLLLCSALSWVCVPSAATEARSAARSIYPPAATMQPLAIRLSAKPHRAPHDDGCPSGWTCRDIGNPASAGSQSFDGTSGTVSGSSFFAPSGDAFHYAWEPLGSGSTATVAAHVSSVTGTGPYTSAGIVLRNGTDPSSFFYAVIVNTTGGIQVSYRNVDGQMNNATIPSTVSQYVQITRSGFLFTAWTSSSGTPGSWTAIPDSTIGIDMSSMDAGITAMSGDSSLATGTIDGFAASSGGDQVTSCPGPWTCQDVGIGSSDLTGSQDSVDGTTWVLDGAGSGFYYNPPNDGFHYVYQNFGPGAVITARLNYQLADLSNGGLGEAGIMFRETNGSVAKDFGVLEQSGSGVIVQTRTCGDPNHCGLGTPLKCANTFKGIPEWLRIVWLGGANFYAYESDDGVTWSQFTCPQADISNTAPWQTTITGGMVTTYGDGSMNAAEFDGVQTIGALSPGTSEYLSPSERSTSCGCADPVDTGNGMFYETSDDLSLAGRGVRLDFQRTYRSDNAAQDSPLGFGWTDSYNLFTTLDAMGNISVHEETGSTVTFVSGGGSYVGPLRVLATLAANVDGSNTVTFTRKDHTRYVFATPTESTPGRLLKEIDPNGYTTTLSYSGGKLSEVQDASGHSLSFAYTDTRQANLGHITSVTDSTGRTVSFGYDAAGNLTDVHDVGRADTGIGHTQYGYDANHRLLTMTDPRGHAVTNVYNTSGRVTSQTRTMAGGNRTTTFSYQTNPDGTFQTTVTDPNGNITRQTYKDNELISQTQGYGTPQAATWAYGYDPATDGITAVTDPNGHEWTYRWDSYGNLTQAVGPASTASATNHETTTIQYTPTDSLFYTSAAVTDSSTVTTTFSYDSSGNLLSISRPLTGSSRIATTTLTYGDTSHPGDVTKITDPNNHATQFAYDASGNLIKETDPAGDISTYSYDAVGRLTAVVSPNGNAPSGTRQLPQPWRYTSTATYDASGDVTSVSDALGNTTDYHYDADGNVTSVVDARQNTTSYAFDEANELTAVTNPDGSSEGFTYDGDGNLLSQSMIAAGGATLRTLGYSYDPLNRVDTATDPNGRVTAYTYDGAGNLLSRLDPMNRTTNYGYDELNEPISVTYHDSGTPDVAFTYTSLGQRATMSDGSGTSGYTYDSLGRLTKAVNGASQEVDYGYDLGGNLTTLTYPASPSPLTVTRHYDAADRMTDVIDWSGNDTHFTYDPDGNITSELFSSSTNGASEKLTYDATDALKAIVASRTTGSNPFIWVFGYGRDPLGQVSAATDRYPGMRHTYSYDALNRLTRDQAANQTASSWTYDAADNIKTFQDTASNITKTFSYDSHNDQLTGLQTTGSTSQNLGFSYNADGDRTQATDLSTNTTINTYSYNQESQLTGFTQGSTSASYSYDGDGLRTSKTVNGALKSYLWDAAEGLPLVIEDGGTKYITGPEGLPVEQVDGTGNVEYYLQDQVGSTRGLLDSSGNIASTYTYGAYGDLKGHSGIATPFEYAGQYADAESGLQYLRARYYDSATEGFLTVDPLLPDTELPYAYARATPLNAYDPLGADIFGIGGFVKRHAGAIAAVAVGAAVVGGAVVCVALSAGICAAVAPEAAAGAAGALGGAALLASEAEPAAVEDAGPVTDTILENVGPAAEEGGSLRQHDPEGSNRRRSSKHSCGATCA
jgi:RHS repeat-associated protein